MLGSFISFDKVYTDIMAEILETGTGARDRTSVGSNIKTFGHALKFHMGRAVDLYSYYVPFMQCRAFSPRIVFEELMWMLRGQTDAKILQEKKITIWDANTTREYLDKQGLSHLPEGDIGKGYGYQMRNFGGVDQLKKVFENLRDNPNDRRHIINFWNVPELPEMALPPCHYDYQFVPVGKTLNLRFTLRSNDFVYGFPYNMAFAAMWLAFFAKALKMEAGELMYVGGDVHIYSNQIEFAEATINQYKANSHAIWCPRLLINKELSTLEDILSLEFSDLEIINFNPMKNPIQKVDMAQ